MFSDFLVLFKFFALEFDLIDIVRNLRNKWDFDG